MGEKLVGFEERMEVLFKTDKTGSAGLALWATGNIK